MFSNKPAKRLPGPYLRTIRKGCWETPRKGAVLRKFKTESNLAPTPPPPPVLSSLVSWDGVLMDVADVNAEGLD
jgi:hypothetical protein